MFDSYTNVYARRIRAFAKVVFVIGVLVGLIMWFQDFETFFIPFLTSVLYAAVAALLMYGFAEMIEILYRIYERFESVDGIKRLLADRADDVKEPEE